jgi:hypothetical protein
MHDMREAVKRISNRLNSCINISIRELSAVDFLLLDLKALFNPCSWRKQETVIWLRNTGVVK